MGRPPEASVLDALDVGLIVTDTAGVVVYANPAAVKMYGHPLSALLGANVKERMPALDALLVAFAISLLVNDTPTDVAGYGGLSALLLWAWARSEEREFPLQ